MFGCPHSPTPVKAGNNNSMDIFYSSVSWAPPAFGKPPTTREAPGLFAGTAAKALLCICSLLPLAAHAFGLEDVINRARKLAEQPYEAPKSIPDFMREISYDEFRQIRFNPDKMLWSESHARFQVMLVSAGRTYSQPVRMNIVDSAGIHRLPFRKDLFNYGNEELEKRVPADLGYAGFKLTYPINKPDVQDQFLVFAGASYFRGVGAGDHFGLSARGLAVDTGLLSGEEFPNFREFWLLRPSPNARSMKVYGLLDSKRITGAYEFIIHPGKPTRIDVNCVLFTRDSIKLLGIAPLTSMFFHGENTHRPRGNWRPEVHDSDGLLIHNGTGEWLWRPLLDPIKLQTHSFTTQDVQGFGLFQRDGNFLAYQDSEARYEQRPDAWVEAQGDWGDGRVVLVEIPTQDETNDNIVAFWAPPEETAGKRQFEFSYRLSLGRSVKLPGLPGHVVNTFVGRGDVLGGGNVKGAYRIIADFKGGPLEKLSPRAPVIAKVTGLLDSKVLEQYVEYVEQSNVWRLSILAKPANGRPLELRGFLQTEDNTLTETWTYNLPVDNSILGPGE